MKEQEVHLVEDVYKILYCSRNLIAGSLEQRTAEIRKILDSARTNNAARNITGALLFNGECFAQVLQRPVRDVEQTFAKISRDMRHYEITILEAGYVPQRDFPDWSMAFTGTTHEPSMAGSEFDFDQAFENPSAAAVEVRNLLRTLVVQEDDYALMQ